MDKVKRIATILEMNLKNRDGAVRVGVSLSQDKRYKKEFKKHGSFGLLHKGFGNKNACKYSEETKQHIIATYNAESAAICNISEGRRNPRKLKVFSGIYGEKYNINLPYTSCKKILNDAGIESPICKFEEEKASNIALPNSKNKQAVGFEFQGDGSTSYKFPDDDFEVTAHVVVEVTSNHLCGLNFQKGECNLWYYYAYRYAFVNVGIPKQNSTDGRTTFFNVHNKNTETTMAKIFSKLGVTSLTTRNCNRNNKVENAHDPVRDYIWDQMLIDGIRTFKEANEKLPHYIKLYNKILNHKINEDNVFSKLSSDEIDDAFLVHDIRSMDNKYTIQVDKKRYFVVKNNTILQKSAKTKINIYTTYNQEKFVMYGNNKYELVEATVDNLAKLKKIDGQIISVVIKKNGYNFSYNGSNCHAIDSLGIPVKLKHRDQIKISIINGVIKKARTEKGIYKILEGVVEIEEDILITKTRKLKYKQTIEYENKEFVLIDVNGERFIGRRGSEIKFLILNNKVVSAMHNGFTFIPEDTKKQIGKYYIPISHYDAKKNFGDML